jgi:hypothetical protein
VRFSLLLPPGLFPPLFPPVLKGFLSPARLLLGKWEGGAHFAKNFRVQMKANLLLLLFLFIQYIEMK